MRISVSLPLFFSIIVLGCGAPPSPARTPASPSAALSGAPGPTRLTVGLEHHVARAVAMLGGALYVSSGERDGDAGALHRLATSNELARIAPDGAWTHASALASDESHLYLAQGASVHVVDRGGAIVSTVDLGPEALVRGLAIGYGGAFFASDFTGGRVFVVERGEPRVLAEGLGHARALLMNGGTLLVGTERDLLLLDLSSGERTVLVAEIGTVAALSLDHVGYFVAAVEGRGLLRVTPQGDITELTTPIAHPASLAFDAASRTVHVVDAEVGDVVALDYLALVGEDPRAWADRDARAMKPFARSGYQLDGAEYWPYRGDREPDYPADVLWGFYPERGVVFEGEPATASATPEAVACAERSYEALRAFLAAPPPALAEAVRLGASNRFYLWTNDYSESSDPFPHEVRPNRFWYWQRNPAVVGRIPGFWKWETTLTRDGRCLVPERAQIDAYLAEKLSELSE